MRSLDSIVREILERIVEKIEHVDFIRLAAVSKSFRQVVIDNLHRLPRKLPMRYCLPHQAPVPLLMHCSDAEDEDDTLIFYSIVDQKYVSKFSLPEIKGWRIVGSSFGWLIMTEMHGPNVCLLNPFTGARICLPHQLTYEVEEGDDTVIEDDGFLLMNKVTTSFDPTIRSRGDDCMVVTLFNDSGLLCYCRPGDVEWTQVCDFENKSFFTDVIYYKGKFYVVSDIGFTVAYDLFGDGKVEVIANAVTSSPKMRYLVQSESGDLLQVARTNDKAKETTIFYLYRLEDRGIRDYPDFKWVKLQSVGDQVLFVHRSSSLCLPANSVPGARRNCIYFINDAEYNDTKPLERTVKDMSYGLCVYDIETRGIEPVGEMKDEPFKLLAWILPNPW